MTFHAFLNKIDLFHDSTEWVLIFIVILAIGLVFLKRFLRTHYHKHVDSLNEHLEAQATRKHKKELVGKQKKK